MFRGTQQRRYKSMQRRARFEIDLCLYFPQIGSRAGPFKRRTLYQDFFASSFDGEGCVMLTGSDAGKESRNPLSSCFLVS